MKNKLLKIIVSMAMISTLFTTMAFSVSAACIPVGATGDIFTTRSDGIGSIGTLKSSLLDDEARAFLRDWRNDNGTFFVTTDGTSIYFFKMISGNVKAGTSSSNNTVWFLDCTLSSVAFSVTTGDPVKEDLCGNSTDNFLFTDSCPSYGSGNMNNIGFSKFIQYKALSKYGITKQNAFFSIWSPVYTSPNGDFYVVFDDNLKDEPPVSSEPEPLPPVSSEPLPPYDYPDFPTIGGSDNKYVPYDTTLWNGFADYIKGSIGSAVNIGMLILAGLLCIWIAIWLVKRFTK